MKKISAIVFTLITILCVAFVPIKAKAAATYIKSEAAVLIEAETGAVLYNKNMDRKMYPASITKIMTGLIALEKCKLTDVMQASYNSVHNLPYNSSHIALDTGEKISVKDAMYALAIESANDVANVFAEHIAGSNEEFAVMMTDRAKEIGAKNTNFTNPHGLPDTNHYTTAYDMAIITAEAIKHNGFSDFFSTNRYDMGPTNIKNETRQFWNANNFINGYDRVEGLIMSKTGWTEESGHTLVTAARQNGVTLIAVVMSSEHKKEKFEDTMALFDYGFEKFYNLEINTDIIRGKVPANISTHTGNNLEIPQQNYMIENFLVTIPKNLTEHDLKYDFSTVVPNSDNSLADGQIEIYYIEKDEKIICGRQNFSVILGQTMENIPPKVMPLVIKIGLWLFYGVIALLVIRLIFIMLRQVVIIENRRRINENRRRQAAERRQHTDEMNVRNVRNVQQKNVRLKAQNSVGKKRSRENLPRQSGRNGKKR